VVALWFGIVVVRYSQDVDKCYISEGAFASSDAIGVASKKEQHCFHVLVRLLMQAPPLPHGSGGWTVDWLQWTFRALMCERRTLEQAHIW
jgi:hypothetical protein